jgi:hypothetical protein
MKITNIVVFIKNHGTDEIHLETNLPSPFPPSVSTEPLTFKAHVRAGGGVAYVREHFPDIPAETLNMSTGKRAPIEKMK